MRGEGSEEAAAGSYGGRVESVGGRGAANADRPGVGNRVASSQRTDVCGKAKRCVLPSSFADSQMMMHQMRS